MNIKGATDYAARAMGSGLAEAWKQLVEPQQSGCRLYHWHGNGFLPHLTTEWFLSLAKATGAGLH